MNIVEQWEASLTALDMDHAERQAWVFRHVPASCQLNLLRELNELRAATEDAMRAYYFLDATEPSRVTRRGIWRAIADQWRCA